MTDSDNYPFKRVLLKLSGEALAGDRGNGIERAILQHVVDEIKSVYELGIEIGLVIGAGNIIRGAEAKEIGINKSVGDYMGMLATVINALAIQDALLSNGMKAVVMSSIQMDAVVEFYTLRSALKYFKDKYIIIFAAGTGHPFFTTDTAAALKACEINADILLKATKVDGVYDKDPIGNNDAVKYNDISYIEVLEKQLKIMDLTAISLCMENKIPLMVFNLFDKGSLLNIINGKQVGTKIS